VSTREAPLAPHPNPDTAGFWAATANGQLGLCRCDACARWIHPPLERCPACAGPVGFEPVSGRGRVYSFIVVGRVVVPGSAPGDVIALVALDEQEGLRLTARLVGVSATDVEIGMPVRAELVPVPGTELRIPVFRPDQANRL
jgi:uncharacterized OB-fold protein